MPIAFLAFLKHRTDVVLTEIPRDPLLQVSTFGKRGLELIKRCSIRLYASTGDLPAISSAIRWLFVGAVEVSTPRQLGYLYLLDGSSCRRNKGRETCDTPARDCGHFLHLLHSLD